MKFSTILPIASLALAAACVSPEPVVSDYNGASVKIQQNIALEAPNPDDPRIAAEAGRICGTAGKRAEYASTVTSQQNYTATHLFLCL